MSLPLFAYLLIPVTEAQWEVVLHLYPPSCVGLIQTQSQGNAFAYCGVNVLLVLISFMMRCLNQGFDLL